MRSLRCKSNVRILKTALIALVSLAVACTQEPSKTSPDPTPKNPAAEGVADTSADYWPTDQWREGPPESEGFSSRALATMVAEVRNKGLAIHSLLVIRRGTIILDANFYPFAAGTRHENASNTKSITSLLVGAAVLHGKLKGLDQPILGLIHERPSQPDPRKARITLGDLLAMRSGLDCGFHGESELDGMRASGNWVQTALDIPMRSEPDATIGYCSPNYHLVSKALQDITGMPMAAFAQQTVFGRLGINDYLWPRDAKGVTHGWGDLQLKTRDLAKIGYLCLHDGVWDGTRILPAGWIARTTRPLSKYNATDSYGFGW